LPKVGTICKADCGPRDTPCAKQAQGWRCTGTHAACECAKPLIWATAMRDSCAGF